MRLTMNVSGSKNICAYMRYAPNNARVRYVKYGRVESGKHIYLDLIKVVILRHSANANYSTEILHIIIHYSTVYCGQPFQELTFLIW